MESGDLGAYHALSEYHSYPTDWRLSPLLSVRETDAWGENLVACPKLPSKQVIGVFVQIIQRDTGSLSNMGSRPRARSPSSQMRRHLTYKDLFSLHVIRQVTAVMVPSPAL